MKHKGFLKSAAIISAGGFAAKAVGALYRVLLVGVVGGYGMGLYQMAYPLFCVLLTFSSTGIPSAFSRVVARERAAGRNTEGTVKTALLLFAALGVAGSIFMAALSPFASGLQGDNNLRACYYALAPSVFFVALIAVLRGYFQGKNDMSPTALSEVLEQLVKTLFGLFFAYRFSAEPARAVAYTLGAVTLSEGFALAFLLLRYRREPRRGTLRARRVSGSEILFSALPVMAAASLLPLSQTADSVIIVRLLSRYTARSVSLYGLFTGGAVSLVNLPASLCYGFVAASVPSVSTCFARGEEEEGRRRAMYALLLTLALALPCAAGLFAFARPIVGMLYKNLSPSDAETLVRLIRLSSVSAATLAGVDTLAACLTGMGRAGSAALSMSIAVLVKFALQFALVRNPAFSIAGAAVAANACYLVAFFLDLIYTLRRTKKRTGEEHDYDNRLRNGTGRRDCAGSGDNGGGGQGASPHRPSALCNRLEGSGN